MATAGVGGSSGLVTAGPGRVIYKTKTKKGSKGPGLDLPKLDYLYVTLRGYGTGAAHQISVMCGDEPPIITDGYAKWTTVDRPLRTGVTTFQGYNPASMQISLRFGLWEDSTWQTDQGKWNPKKHTIEPVVNRAGKWVEGQIALLEWMAGANFGAGAPPFVYANTYGPHHGTTDLISSNYQETAAAGKTVTDTKRWPWVINGGVNWGKSIRNAVGSRIYQECDFTLLNWQGFSAPATTEAAGGYFKSSKTYWNCLAIAGAPSSHAMDVEPLAKAIYTSHMNNPVKGSKRTRLESLKLTGRIKPNLDIWVPSHVI